MEISITDTEVTVSSSLSIGFLAWFRAAGGGVAQRHQGSHVGASVWGPRIQRFKKGAQSGPLVRVAVKEPIRTSLDEGNPIFLGIFSDFRRRSGCYRNSLEGVDGGPCRDRTYDQLIKSQLLYQLS
jgi:hypothetical protein